MIVIVALGLTALVAMAGLVIDGGMALRNRRQVQNAADAAALAGTRVLSLDLKWRAVNADNPSPETRPFANADPAVCDAINNALAYNTNGQQTIAAIDCLAGSPDAKYVDFDGRAGLVGDGIPAAGPGRQGHADGRLGDVPHGRDRHLDDLDRRRCHSHHRPRRAATRQPHAVRRPEPAGPVVPGEQYQIRSEDEGQCDSDLDGEP